MVRQIVDSYIHPTDVKIYYENNVPYMEYRGRLLTWFFWVK